MNRTLLLALGLSAVDGILCAFVAILAFAMTLLDTPAQARQDVARGAVILSITKRVDAGLMNLQFAITVETKAGSSEKASATLAPDPDGGVTRILMRNARHTSVRAIAWHDCTSSTNQECTARLVLTGVAPDVDLTVTVRPASELDRAGGGPNVTMTLKAYPFFDKDPDPFQVPFEGQGQSFTVHLKDGVPHVEAPVTS